MNFAETTSFRRNSFKYISEVFNNEERRLDQSESNSVITSPPDTSIPPLLPFLRLQ